MNKAEETLIHNEYIYMRTKDYIVEDNTEKLYLYAGLVIKQYETADKEVTKKVIPVHSEIIEVEVSNIPPFTKEIPSGTVNWELTKKQFHKLLTKAYEYSAALFIFKL